MTSRAPQPMPEGMNRSNRPKAPAAPRSPTNMNIEEAKQTLFEHEARLVSDPEYRSAWVNEQLKIYSDYFNKEIKNE